MRLRALIVVIAVVAFSACSTSRSFVVGKVTATRGADDHVTVTVPVTCDETGYSDGCALVECVEAAWGTGFGMFDPFTVGVGVYPAGTVVDKVQLCRTESVANGQGDTFVLTSDSAIPTGLELGVLGFPQSGAAPGYDDVVIIDSP